MQLLRFLDTHVCVTHTAEVPARPAGASELVAAGPSRCPLALRSSRWAQSGARPQVPAALRARPPRGRPWPAHTPAEGPPSLPGGGGTHPSPSFALPSVLFLSPGPRGVSRDSCSAGGRVGVPGAGRGSRGGRAGPPQATPPPPTFFWSAPPRALGRERPPLKAGPRGLPEGASLPSLSSRRAQPTRRRSVSAARGGTVRSSWTATCKSTQQSGTQHIAQQADRTPRDAVTRTRRRDATRRHDANVTHDAVTRT